MRNNLDYKRKHGVAFLDDYKHYDGFDNNERSKFMRKRNYYTFPYIINTITIANKLKGSYELTF